MPNQHGNEKFGQDQTVGIYGDSGQRDLRNIENYKRTYKVQEGANNIPGSIAKGFTCVENPKHPAKFQSENIPMGAGKPFVPKGRK